MIEKCLFLTATTATRNAKKKKSFSRKKVVKKFVDRTLNVVSLHRVYERCHRDSKAKNYAIVTEKIFLSYGEN